VSRVCINVRTAFRRSPMTPSVALLDIWLHWSSDSKSICLCHVYSCLVSPLTDITGNAHQVVVWRGTYAYLPRTVGKTLDWSLFWSTQCQFKRIQLQSSTHLVI